jgi:anti-sigma factor RsiW
MDHERARADFMGHRDGDLPEAERQALEEHLAGCPDCRREWEAYGRTVDGVSGLRVIAPPSDLVRQVTRAIERREGRRPFGQLSLMGVRLAVLSLVLIMLLLMAYLTYLLLFAAPEQKGGARSHEHGDYHIIGPVKVETHPEKKDGR